MNEDDIAWSGEMNRTRKQDYFQGVILKSDTIVLLVAPPNRDRVRPNSKSYARKMAAYVKEPLTADVYLRRGLIRDDLGWDYQRAYISVQNVEGKEVRDDPARESVAAYYASLSPSDHGIDT